MSTTDALHLNETEMFSKIREGLIPPPQKTQDLLECKDDFLYAWDTKQAHLLVTNWRSLQKKPNKSDCQYQTLIPSTPQNYEVERVVASIEGSLIALVGARGVTLLETPRRWGKSGQFMDGKEQIICRAHTLDSLLFHNNPQLEVRQVRWHPGSTTDSHLLVLFSDNTIRLYNNSQKRNVWQVGPVQVARNTNSSFNAFGETAVDFDIAPAVKVATKANDLTLNGSCNTQNSSKINLSLNSTTNTTSKTPKPQKFEWPLIILRENGNVYVLMTSLDGDKNRLQGPITITPQMPDNYGLDSCSILVIPSSPPTLVIAETNGKLHHALFLENETSEDSFNEVDVNLDIQPSEWTIYVLETVELELGLPKNHKAVSDTVGNSCPIHLKRDYINELRYFAFHETGLHVVSVNFITELQRFLESDSVDDISLSTPSSAEYLVCTKLDANDRINAVLGFVLLQMPASLVLLLGSGQVISLKVVISAKMLEQPHTNWPSIAGEQLEQLIEGPTFVEHIQNILRRSITQPILSADKTASYSPHDCYELVNQAVEVLRAQYLKRHDLVRAEFSKRINRIRLQKEQQLREIENLEREREVISERAHKLAERFEEISDAQEILIKKCQDLMQKANMALPGNVAEEREFAEEVARINKATKSMAASLENVKKSINKQSYHIAKSGESSKQSNFELPEKQQRIITEILTQVASEIDKQIKDIKRISKLVGI